MNSQRACYQGCSLLVWVVCCDLLKLGHCPHDRETVPAAHSVAATMAGQHWAAVVAEAAAASARDRKASALSVEGAVAVDDCGDAVAALVHQGCDLGI